MPWADVLYACDYDWWAHNQGRMDFAGLKIGGDVREKRKAWDVHPVRIDPHRNEIMVYRFGTIGSSGNSGFQALNLAVQFGCRVIILVGFDMHDHNGLHWHGKHGGNLNNPTRVALAKWRAALDGQAEPLRRMGVTVLNASPTSALTAFPKMTIEEALRVAHKPVDRQAALAG